MNVVVVGAGAVGGYFGGRLQEAGLQVTFLVRENRAEQLRQTGLVIQSPAGNVCLTPKVAVNASDIDNCDLVLLAVKNYHLEPVYQAIRPLVERGAKILPLLNGVEHFDRLTQTFGKTAVLGGLCQIIVTLNHEGHIVHTSKMHDLIFGPLDPSQTAFCDHFCEISKNAMMPITLSKNILSDIWGKYAFITAFSGVTTASRLPISDIMNIPATKQVYQQLLAEMVELALKKGVRLADCFVEKTLERMNLLPAGSTSSMHQDFRKGLPLEVESLQGAAVRLGQDIGLTLPTVAAIYGLVKPYENGNC